MWDNFYYLTENINASATFALGSKIKKMSKSEAGTDGGSEGSTPHLSWKMGGGVGGVFFGKIRHNKQKLSINLTFFPFSFDQMFTSLSF